MEETWPFEGKQLDWTAWRHALGLSATMQDWERWIKNWRGFR